ncbi:hypothetical protein AZE42_12439, partial [Rhizopogon vesiculosus]
MSYVNITR